METPPSSSLFFPFFFSLQLISQLSLKFVGVATRNEYKDNNFINSSSIQTTLLSDHTFLALTAAPAVSKCIHHNLLNLLQQLTRFKPIRALLTLNGYVIVKRHTKVTAVLIKRDRNLDY